jgi:hypothetical protein
MSVKRMSSTTKQALNEIIREAQGIQRLIEHSIVGDDLTPLEVNALASVAAARVESAAWRVLNSHHEDKPVRRTGDEDPAQ